MVIQSPAPAAPSYVVTPLQVPAPAGLAPGPAALAFTATLAELEETVGDTTLLQAEDPVPVVDTTLLQADIDLGLAVMTEFQGGVSPAPSPLYPRPDVPVPVTDLAEVKALPVLPHDYPIELPQPALAAPAPEAPPDVRTSTDLDTLVLAESNLAEAKVLQTLQPEPEPVAGSILLQAEVAAYEAAAAADPKAEALAAQALSNEEEQKAFMAVLQAGVANVPLLTHGPVEGIEATLAGAGWVRPPDVAKAAEAASHWAFHLFYKDSEVPAVTASAQAEPAGTRKGPQQAGEPLQAYDAHGGQTPPLDGTRTSSVDILD